VSGGAATPVLRGPRVLLRPVAEDDLDAVLAILAEPEVARWWPPGDSGETRAELPRPGVGLAVVVGGEVAAGNARAIRAYAAVGFRPVGVLRAYERGADGTWHDGLLMDLLAGEPAG
jgi:RimJ/RimL family protein N-acetyltransferase